MTKGLAELLEEISEITSRKNKIERLRQESGNKVLRVVVELCFNSEIKWLLPEGSPPFTLELKERDLQSVLYANARKLEMFVNSDNFNHIRPVRREQLFIQFLESLDPDDANLILAIKDRKMPYKGLTNKLFAEAWPDMASRIT